MLSFASPIDLSHIELLMLRSRYTSKQEVIFPSVLFADRFLVERVFLSFRTGVTVEMVIEDSLSSDAVMMIKAWVMFAPHLVITPDD